MEEIGIFAAIKSKIESYDDLFEIMPKMGALTKKTGCKAACPNIALQIILQQKPKSSYKREKL